MNVLIVGAGSFGTSIGKILAENNCAVKLYSHEKKVIGQINDSHENKKYLKGIKLPEGIEATESMESGLLGIDTIIVAVPSIYVASVISKISNNVEGKNIPIGIVTKGFIDIGGKPLLISEALKDLPIEKQTAYLYGPTNAHELANGTYSGFICASENKKIGDHFYKIFKSSQINIHQSQDIEGVQFGAAMKNIYAIFCGMVEGLESKGDKKIGYNTKSYIFSLFMDEMEELLSIFSNAKCKTISGVAFLGDLFMSCSSPYCRNRRFGHEIVSKEILSRNNWNIDKVLENTNYLPEGVYALKQLHKRKKNFKIKTPIIDLLYEIVYKKRDPKTIMEVIFK